MSVPVKDLFSISCTQLPESFWQASSKHIWTDPEKFLKRLESFAESNRIPAYLPDLARAEMARNRSFNQHQPPITTQNTTTTVINPTLEVVEVGWHSLLSYFDGAEASPAPASQILLFWRHPVSGKNHQAVGTAAELLALKVVAEQLDPKDVANANHQPVGRIDSALESAVCKGLLLAPPSRLRRDSVTFSTKGETPEKFLAAEVFTLQWHITHRCELHCRHCYDRSDRHDVALDQGLEILDQVRQFCLDHYVGGQISFSGGNPFMHPDFLRLYQAAHDRNLNLAILGNPVSSTQLDTLLEVTPPAFFQVSLEGLEEHNDLIRGKGNFRSVLDFLDLLRDRQVYSMVMLTLTHANIDQVLPLAELLRDRVDLFTFNRLAMVGEGAKLESPHPGEYSTFIQEYLKARENNPCIALKDSLINIELDQQKQGLFGGCTGFGCGAAFNFVSLLPDGQVDACRKFPSPIGNINQQSLSEIYASDLAESYRKGCVECAACHLRPVCGGCLAVAYGRGLDPLQEKDPACFITLDSV